MRPATFSMERDPFLGVRTYKICIQDNAFNNAWLGLSNMEKRLTEEQPKSIADCLINLEMIVRAIEKSQD